jgi:prepilin-type N-terminal cleavage/methylation domain-containing protein
MTKLEEIGRTPVRHSSFVIDSSFVIRHSSFRNAAFTIIELLIVMTIILVLAGLILATAGYVQKKGARSRTEAEIAAMSAALESYKADNGVYPTEASTTEMLKANAVPDGGKPATFTAAGQFFYKAISGDSDGNPSNGIETKGYLTLKPNMLSPNPPSNNTYIHDPFGNCYGYSTVKAAHPTGSDGYNPTFDLWSTGGTTSGGTSDRAQWIKNW